MYTLGLIQINTITVAVVLKYDHDHTELFHMNETQQTAQNIYIYIPDLGPVGYQSLTTRLHWRGPEMATNACRFGRTWLQPRRADDNDSHSAGDEIQCSDG